MGGLFANNDLCLQELNKLVNMQHINFKAKDENKYPNDSTQNCGNQYDVNNQLCYGDR